MARDVALVTPSHRNDIERFALLCESIDRHVRGYEKHYVIVNDDDVPLFARFISHRRIVVPCSQLLPRWLKLIPSVLRKRPPSLVVLSDEAGPRLAHPADSQDRGRFASAGATILYHRLG